MSHGQRITVPKLLQGFISMHVIPVDPFIVQIWVSLLLCFLSFCLLHHHADYHWDRLFLCHHIPLTYDLFDHSYLLTYLTPSMTHDCLPM
jgi:hypothetical protein